MTDIWTRITFNGVEKNPQSSNLMYAMSVTDAGLTNHGARFRDPTDPNGNKPLSMPVNETMAWSNVVKFGVDTTKIVQSDRFLMSNSRELAGNWRTPLPGTSFQSSNVVASKFLLTFLKDGVIYTVDDLWIVFGLNNLQIFSNWKGMEAVDFTKIGQTVQLLAWRGPDKAHRCVIELQSGAYKDGSTDITVKYAGELDIHPDEPASGLAFDEFNLTVCDLIRAGGFTDFRPLISDPVYRDWLKHGLPHKVIPVLEEYGPTEFSCASIEIDPNTLRASYTMDYSSTTVMDNNTTETMTFKTPDYTHKHTDTTQIQTNISAKQTGKLSFKGSEKVTIDEKIMKEEVAIEQAIEVGWELSGSKTTTTTTSDEKTYTCPGQTVAVPAGKSYQATCIWKKGSIDGHIDTFYPMKQDPALWVYYFYADPDLDHWEVSKVRTNLSVGDMEKIFGKKLASLRMANIKMEGPDGVMAPAPTPCVLQRFAFHSDAGLLSEFSVKQTGDKK